ncbi:MAG: class I SAM-dependent methyltransferase, partial [Nitrospinota bacterium]
MKSLRRKRVTGMFEDNLKYENQKRYWESTRERRAPEHPVIKAFAEPKIEFVKKSISTKGQPGGPRLSMLDVGCGNGFLTFYLEKQYDIVALDFSLFMLKNHSYKKNICGSAMDLPFEDGSFDATFCSNLMHHLDKPERAVSEMKRVSRRYVILSEPNRNNP